ncbi:hypothetical protein J2797_006372 [Paraburkholderia terricola]|uniref:AAA domain-containing protein n=2 Tax=Paraburkholderia terricola TaxID=169427 RepID=A0ABU1M263_9BURK|nr:hypothetical protein [Paraburkholderia terricola]MDR6450339.1 hypothetical protein [Paraburkholderia terricola]MDR6485241.1 hypothetical protein [Paraburkholderia terricola]MDR6496445.1 hypothetical protein [Paraburkholderia terricola]
MFLDEAQRFNENEYEWLRDVHDVLDRQQIKLFTFLVGQEELLAQKTALQLAGKTQIVARLMVDELAFYGIRNAQDVATCLNDYDQTAYPEGNRSFFRCLAACRTRSSACGTLARFCARHVCDWSVFPLVPALGSTHSAASFPALFAGFFATMAESDFSRPFIIGYGSSPSRCGPAHAATGQTGDLPVSRTRSVRACQGLRPRRADGVLAIIALRRVAFRNVNGVGARDN